MKRYTAILFVVLVLAIALFCFNRYMVEQSKINAYEKMEETVMNEAGLKQDLYIFIDIPIKKLYVFKQGELFKTYTVATGARETPTPIGIFKVISKGEWGEGFGGNWIGLNVPWGKYGIHGTTHPESIGRAASHGCIRMKNKDVDELSHMASYGVTVEIYGGSFGPFGMNLRNIYPGDRGSDIMEIQRRLKLRGYYNGSIDGNYGRATENAINRFQKDNKLQVTNVINQAVYKKLGIIRMD